MDSQKEIIELLNRSENQLCADCKCSNPRYVSMQYGIFICESCASIHRTELYEEYFSEIKSVNNSKWNQKEAELLEQIGNSVSNNYYESRLPSNFSPLTNGTESLTNFIKDKYENRRWSEPNRDPPLDSTVPILLTKMAAALNVGVHFVLFILVIVSIIVLFIFKLFKFSHLVKLLSIELTFLTEFFSSDIKYPKLGIGFFVEFLYGMIGFGFSKGVILAVLMKVIRKSFTLKKYNNLVFLLAVSLFFYFFGFENILIIVFSNFLLVVLLIVYFFRFIRGSVFCGISLLSKLGKNISKVLNEEILENNKEDETPLITGRVEEVLNEESNSNEKNDEENSTVLRRY